jgi:hypothetical protein
VVWMILQDSLLLMTAGVVIGVPLALLVGHALASSLYGVKPLDAVSYLLAVSGVAVVALFGECRACWARGQCRPHESSMFGITCSFGR